MNLVVNIIVIIVRQNPDSPGSYLSSEPTPLRAVQNAFDCFCQFYTRCLALEDMGHVIDKLEILVLGGTWSSYPVSYQEEFIRDVYFSANVYYDLRNGKDIREKMSMDEEIEFNAGSSDCHIIGLTLETRPDVINIAEILRFRTIWCNQSSSWGFNTLMILS